jgi:hypothetical protein
MENDKPKRHGSRNPVKEGLVESLRKRVQQYRSQRDRLDTFLGRNPLAPTKEREADRGKVTGEIERLEGIFLEVLPHIRKIRSHIATLMEHTNLVACYFLLGKTAQSIRAIFLLGREGFHQEVMEIVRSSREALDLVGLFLREGPDSQLLKKWFEGEIVENEKARKAMTKRIKEVAKGSGITLPLDEMKAGVYGGLSKYAHVAYAALLDSYDVYSDDFDFERTAGFHYVKASSLPYVEVELQGLIITLKDFYQTMGDAGTYRELDSILRRHAPHMYEATQNEAIDDIRRRFPGFSS